MSSRSNIFWWRLKNIVARPKYKNDLEIPGGIIEDSESPKECCEREILEELGLEKIVWELLCLEYQRENDDSYMFVFDWWVLSEEEIWKIKLQESEIKSFGFYGISEIKDKVLKKMFVRIGSSVKAMKEEKSVYYETVYEM